MSSSLVDLLMSIVAPTGAFSLAAVCLVVFFLAAHCAPWHQLRITRQLHVFLGSTASLFVLWNIRTHLGLSAEFHLLGATAATLVLGWPLAVVAVSLAQIGLALTSETNLNNHTVTIVANGMVPIVVTEFIRRLALSKLPANFFVYVFVSAFFAGGLAMAMSRLALIGHALVTDAALGSDALYLLSYLPLMALPEALINGMLLALLVTYRPQWVATFDDAYYLQGK